jgi:serine phosphatase RsbU (regulator of sigma subunit)
VIADTDAGPVLGLGVDVARSSSTMQLSPGMTIVFYTDGLIERRGESLDLGLERLRAVVSSTTPRQVAHTVMRELIGNADPQDDVALLVVHMTAA